MQGGGEICATVVQLEYVQHKNLHPEYIKTSNKAKRKISIMKIFCKGEDTHGSSENEWTIASYKFMDEALIAQC